MEWVETTGKTLEEAKDAALDQLGVAEDDAEFEVVEEPKLGLFGRVRNEARVRARVRPTAPRPKDDRRDRRRRDQKRKSGDNGSTSSPPAGARGGDGDGNGQQATATEKNSQRAPKRAAAPSEGTPVEEEVGKQADVARAFVAGLVEEFDLDAEVTVVEI